MTLLDQLLLKRLDDVDVFGDRKRSVFAPTSRAVELFDDLKTVIAQTKTQQSDQTIGGGGGVGATKTKTALIGELWRDMGTIEKSARVMKSLSDTERAFFVRPARRELEIVNSAQTFITQGTPLWAKFVAYELPSGLLGEIQADLTAYNNSYRAQQGSIQSRIGATSGIDEALERGQEIIDELRPLVNNKFSGDKDTLAEWKSAIRYPERNETKSPAPVPPTPA